VQRNTSEQKSLQVAQANRPVTKSPADPQHHTS
jgi:hypothetical protein